jgi:hypothetical protein
VPGHNLCLERDFCYVAAPQKPLRQAVVLIKKDIAIPQNKTKHICKKRKK